MQVNKPTSRHRPQRGPRLPRNEQRDRVLRLVRDSGDVVDVVELAEQMNLHVTTVRFHLDALCADGVVARTRIKRTGVGRPRTGYIAVRERLDYRSLAEILAMELGETVAERRRRAERAGERWANRIVANRLTEFDDPQKAESGWRRTDPDSAVDDSADMIAQVFGRMGFDPELIPPTASSNGRGERTIRINGCPVRDLATTHPEVSCGMHLGLLRGLLGAHAKMGCGAALRAELDPLVEPEVCLARVMPDG